MSSQYADLSSFARSRARLQTRAAGRRWLLVALAAGDLLAIAAGFFLAYALRFWTGWAIFDDAPAKPTFYLTLAEILSPAWVVLFACYGLYRPRNIFNGSQEYARLFHACTSGMFLVIFASFLEPDLTISRAWLLLAWVCTIVLVGSWRFGARRIIYALRYRGKLLERTVILGANGEGRAVARQLQERPEGGANVIGFIDDERHVGEMVLHQLPVLGASAALQEVVEQHQVDVLIIADPAIVRERLPTIYGAMETLHQLDVRLDPGLFELLTSGVQIHEQCAVPLLALNKSRITGLHALTKQGIDRIGALVGLLLLSPLLLLLALVVFLDSGGPIIHRRRVVGAGRQPFDAFKFRTMHRNAETLLSDEQREELRREGKLRGRDPRITRVGSFLRRASLDELPQLFNVLLGQMSLVGPRMLTEAELNHFGRWQHNLLTVRPGLTGLWQISGRSNLSYEERVRLDMHYIRNYSVWLDLHIIVRTLPALISGRGAY
jgi:exopolysaccharide biosynthesis polyprenyl glycosylphosphotransferase